MMLHSPEMEAKSASPPHLLSSSPIADFDNFTMTFVMRKDTATYTFIIGEGEPIMIVTPDSFLPQA